MRGGVQTPKIGDRIAMPARPRHDGTSESSTAITLARVNILVLMSSILFSFEIQKYGIL